MAQQAKFIVDSCFWIALLDNSDQYHQVANTIYQKYFNTANKIIIPFPTLYEFVNTAMAKRVERLKMFASIAQKSYVERESDEKYKDTALSRVLVLNERKTHESVSLVDEILRQMILDLPFDFLITFNEKDFSYPCKLRDVLIIDQHTELLR